MNHERGPISGQHLHLCDFDGTLTRGDSFVRFLLFAVPLPRLIAGGFVLPLKFSALFFSGKWSNEAGKAAVLSAFFKGKSTAEMKKLGEEFGQKKLPALLRNELLEDLRNAFQNGETVVIVSASPDVWLRPFVLRKVSICFARNLNLNPANSPAISRRPIAMARKRSAGFVQAMILMLLKKLLPTAIQKVTRRCLHWQMRCSGFDKNQLHNLVSPKLNIKIMRYLDSFLKKVA